MPARGFKAITVYEDTYKVIRKLADDRRIAVAQLVQELLASYSPPLAPPPFLGEKNGGEKPKEAVWPWPGPYVQVVTSVKDYKSVALIESEKYVDLIGKEQLDHRIVERVQKVKDFTIEKVLVVSANSWGSGKVWRWIFEWLMLDMAYKGKVQVYIVKQEAINMKQLKEKYTLASIDMGIYDNDMVGFLIPVTGWEKNPSKNLSYAWFFDAESIERAKNAFEELKKTVVDSSEIMGQLKLTSRS